jgi:hypothetical protein
MNDLKTGSDDWAASNRRNTLHLGYWTFAWVASMAVATFGPKLVWNYATLPTIAAVLVNLGVGLGMILANRQYLRGLDELHQKIFLDAGALTLGVGLVCGLSYELLEDIRLIAFEPEFAHVVILMSVTFLAGMIAGHRKYQ